MTWRNYGKAMKQKILIKLGIELKEDWKPFWRTIAQAVYDAEKEWKEQQTPGLENGQLRLQRVKDLAMEKFGARLNLLEKAMLDGVWAIIDDYLEQIVVGFNSSLGRDWVSLVEDWESRIAAPLERFLEIDLDGDQLIDGSPSGMPFVVLFFALLLAGDVEAVGRPSLVPHYPAPRVEVIEEKDGDEAGYVHTVRLGDSGVHSSVSHGVLKLPPPGVRPPLVEHYQQRRGASVARSPSSPTVPPELSVESWIGASGRPGIDTGIGCVLRSGRWAVGLHAAQNRLGPCLGYRRIGVDYLWDPRDGSWAMGGYLVPLRF